MEASTTIGAARGRSHEGVACRAGRVARALLAVAAALVACAMFSARSEATRYKYCNEVYLYGESSCEGPRHSITQNDGYWAGHGDQGWVCVSAGNVDFTQAGSWVCRWNSAHHSYCGCQLRYPWIGNGNHWYEPAIWVGGWATY